jgi:K+ transporter
MRRVDPDTNVSRFYVLTLERDLFGSFAVTRQWGRAGPTSGMPLWQERLFIGLAATASDASEFFQIPTGRVVEVGTQVTV